MGIIEKLQAFVATTKARNATAERECNHSGSDPKCMECTLGEGW